MDMPPTPEAGLAAAIDKMRTASALARGLNITPSAVLQWDRIPASRLGQVASLTGLDPQILRPDIFAPSVVGDHEAGNGDRSDRHHRDASLEAEVFAR